MEPLLRRAHDNVREIIRTLQRRKRILLGRSRDWSLSALPQRIIQMPVKQVPTCLQRSMEATDEMRRVSPTPHPLRLLLAVPFSLTLMFPG